MGTRFLDRLVSSSGPVWLVSTGLMIVCSGDALVRFSVQILNDGQEERIHFWVVSVGNFESFCDQPSIIFEAFGVIPAFLHLYPDSFSEVTPGLLHMHSPFIVGCGCG